MTLNYSVSAIIDKTVDNNNKIHLGIVVSRTEWDAEAFNVIKIYIIRSGWLSTLKTCDWFSDSVPVGY